jgi:hypothetical protein
MNVKPTMLIISIFFSLWFFFHCFNVQALAEKIEETTVIPGAHLIRDEIKIFLEKNLDCHLPKSGIESVDKVVRSTVFNALKRSKPFATLDDIKEHWNDLIDMTFSLEEFISSALNDSTKSLLKSISSEYSKEDIRNICTCSKCLKFYQPKNHTPMAILQASMRADNCELSHYSKKKAFYLSKDDKLFAGLMDEYSLEPKRKIRRKQNALKQIEDMLDGVHRLVDTHIIRLAEKDVRSLNWRAAWEKTVSEDEERDPKERGGDSA